MSAIPVVCYGLGPIGLAMARRVISDLVGLAQVVGAVDVDTAKAGLDLGTLLEREPVGVVVAKSLDEAACARRRSAGVLLHATSSSLSVVAPQLLEAIEHGWNVLSTCEELVYPAVADEQLAQHLHAAAVERGVSVLGAGINPGFLMDTLAIVLATACTFVERLEIRRVVDTDRRRVPLQRKAGVGMEVAEFERLASTGGIGHVGLRQSVQLAAVGLGLPVERYEEDLYPVVAKVDTATALGTVPAGAVIGQRQRAVAHGAGREVVRLDLQMSAGADAVDEVTVVGIPGICQRIEGGVNGDVGTEAVVTNLIPSILNARPGLCSMGDLVVLGLAHGKQPRLRGSVLSKG